MDDTEVVYKVSVPRMVRRSAYCIGFSVVFYVGVKAGFHAWFPNQPNDPFMILVCFMDFFLVLGGLLAIVSVFRELPRLTLSVDGVVYQGLNVTRQVSWEHLGPFRRMGPKKAMIRAQLTEPVEAGVQAQPRQLLIFPANYGKKIGFEDELNEHRHRLESSISPRRFAAASVQAVLPIAALPFSEVIWRGFILFFWQWLLLIAGGVLAVVVFRSISKETMDIMGSNLIKIFIFLPIFEGCLCGEFIRSRKFCPNKSVAMVGIILFVGSALPMLALNLVGQLGGHAIVGMEILFIPFGLCLGLSGWSRHIFL